MSTELTKETYDEIYQSLVEMPFLNFLGIEVLQISKENVKMKLPIKEKFMNTLNTLHGGIHASILDAALGTSVRAHTSFPCMTLNLNISYLNVTESKALYAEGRVIRAGYKNAFAEGELYDEKGEIIAKAVGNFKLVRK